MLSRVRGLSVTNARIHLFSRNVARVGLLLVCTWFLLVVCCAFLLLGVSGLPYYVALTAAFATALFCQALQSRFMILSYSASKTRAEAASKPRAEWRRSSKDNLQAAGRQLTDLRRAATLGDLKIVVDEGRFSDQSSAGASPGARRSSPVWRRSSPGVRRSKEAEEKEASCPSQDGSHHTRSPHTRSPHSPIKRAASSFREMQKGFTGRDFDLFGGDLGATVVDATPPPSAPPQLRCAPASPLAPIALPRAPAPSPLAPSASPRAPAPSPLGGIGSASGAAPSVKAAEASAPAMSMTREGEAGAVAEAAPARALACALPAGRSTMPACAAPAAALAQRPSFSAIV